MFKVGDRVVGKAASPNFFSQIVGERGVIESVNADDPIGPYFVRFDNPELGMQKGYIIQREERSWLGSIGAWVSFHSMSASSDSAVRPAFSNSIICSTVNPACSPAMASLKMLVAIEGVAITTT
jgi:hypothetical protein